MIRFIPLLVMILAACSGLPEATPEITPLEATPSSFNQQDNLLEWKEYRDERFGYGLIVPGDWQILPTPPKGNYATLVIMNFGDEGHGLSSEAWPEGAFKIDIAVVENTDHLALEDGVHKYLENELTGIASVEEGSINNHSGLVAFLSNKERPSDKLHKTFNLLLPDGQFVTISVLPGDGWENPDIEAMLNSFAFPGEDVLIPSTPPTVGWFDLPK
jgi:hypothetical protein